MPIWEITASNSRRAPRCLNPGKKCGLWVRTLVFDPGAGQLSQEKAACFPANTNPAFHQNPVVDSKEVADVEESYLCWWRVSCYSIHQKDMSERHQPDGKDKFWDGSLTDFSSKFRLITSFLLDKNKQNCLHNQLVRLSKCLLQNIYLNESKENFICFKSWGI